MNINIIYPEYSNTESDIYDTSSISEYITKDNSVFYLHEGYIPNDIIMREFYHLEETLIYQINKLINIKFNKNYDIIEATLINNLNNMEDENDYIDITTVIEEYNKLLNIFVNFYNNVNNNLKKYNQNSNKIDYKPIFNISKKLPIIREVKDLLNKIESNIKLFRETIDNINKIIPNYKPFDDIVKEIK
jgi:hypothetical protein